MRGHAAPCKSFHLYGCIFSHIRLYLKEGAICIMYIKKFQERWLKSYVRREWETYDR